MQMSVFFVRVYVFVKQPIKINLAEDFLDIIFLKNVVIHKELNQD